MSFQAESCKTAVFVFCSVTVLCISTFPESKQGATPQEVGNISCVAGKVKDSKELPVPVALYHIHAKTLDPLLEPPVVVANCLREHVGLSNGRLSANKMLYCQCLFWCLIL